jgi:Leucine-rich repeat (LRR) protein
MDAAFQELHSLETLDLSFSKLNIRGVNSSQNVNQLFGSKLIHLSLCFTMISKINENMFRNMDNLKILDISGNYGVAHSLTQNTFKHLNDSLEVLYAKYNSIRSFNWTINLRNLKFINLKHNFIGRIDHESFRYLPNVEIIDVSHNFIINWLTPVFKNNPVLKVLNIRKNYINSFTNDMLKDFSNVDYLTLGNNPFECSCILKDIFDRVDLSGNFTKNDKMSQFFINEDKNYLQENFRPANVNTIVYKTYFANELIKSALRGKETTVASYLEEAKEVIQQENFK